MSVEADQENGTAIQASGVHSCGSWATKWGPIPSRGGDRIDPGQQMSAHWAG